MKKIIILILTTSLFLVSCGDDKPESNAVVNTVPKNIKPYVAPKVETKVVNGELTIGKNVNIKKELSADFPQDFPIITGGEIFQNSNMQKYAFIISNDELENIYNYYKDEMSKQGWKFVDNNQKIDLKVADHFNLKFTKNKTENLSINVNKNIPKLIKENLNLSGNFIEVQFSENVVNKVK